MFSKTADPTAAPAPPVARPSGAPGSNAGRSVLGTDLRITGEVTTTGSIEVLGEVEGNVTAQGLIIGQEGQLKGAVTAEMVEVRGRLDGQVACQSFTLRATAVVKAEVTTQGIVIESGAVMDGRFLKPRA